MRRTIIVLGGALSGPTAAARAREIDEKARIIIVTRDARVSYAAAGIPYHLSGEVDSLDALDAERAEFFEKVYGIEVWTGVEVTGIDAVRKRLQLRGKPAIAWDALVFALGARSRPLEVPLQQRNVNALRTLDDVERLMKVLPGGRVAVIGAGLHGVAAVDGLVRGGAQVTLIERDVSILPQFGAQVTRLAHEELAKKVRVLTRTTVKATRVQKDRVTALTLSNGEQVATDFVVVTAGIMPATELLKQAGAHLAPDGSVYVTERAETSLPSVYACGICVSVPQAISGAHAWSAQGAVADKVAQVAGSNAAGGDARLLPIAGSMLRRVLDLTVGRTGLSERQARAQVGAHFQMTTIHAPSHDAYFPGSHPVLVQLFWDSASGRILGCEAAGRSGVDKRIDIVATALAGGLTVDQLAAIDLGYAPPYGSQRDPINVACTAAAAEKSRLARFVTPEELHGRSGEVVVLDVRGAADHRAGHIPGAVSLPLEELRRRVDKLEKDRSIVTYCDSGRRGYLAARILSQNGFSDVANLEGGFRSWCLTELPVAVAKRSSARS
jgi:NADPH-dependent 2,4-dienoyl-CoA reductase/sulfur reductase-like enzyme/rhodanese-related sulfurtransferase